MERFLVNPHILIWSSTSTDFVATDLVACYKRGLERPNLLNFVKVNKSVTPVVSRYLLAAASSSFRSLITFQRVNQSYLYSKRVTNVSFYTLASFVCLLALFLVVFVHC